MTLSRPPVAIQDLAVGWKSKESTGPNWAVNCFIGRSEFRTSQHFILPASSAAAKIDGLCQENCKSRILSVPLKNKTGKFFRTSNKNMKTLKILVFTYQKLMKLLFFLNRIILWLHLAIRLTCNLLRSDEKRFYLRFGYDPNKLYLKQLFVQKH